MRAEFDKELGKYLDHVKEKYSANTLRHKRRVLNQASSYFREQGWMLDTQKPEKMADHIHEYFDDEETNTANQTTVSAVRSYLKFIGKEVEAAERSNIKKIRSMIKKSDFNIDRSNKTRISRIESRILDEEEIKKMREVADSFEELIFDVLFDSACRVGELTALEVEDIEFNMDTQQGNPATFRISKTYSQGANGIQESPKLEKSYRTTPIGADTAERLKAHIERNNLKGDDRVFYSDKKASTANVKFRDMIKELFTLAKVRLKEKDSISEITPHYIRHTRATLWMREGIPKSQIQKLLGHNLIVSTEVYTHFSDRDTPTVY